MLQRIFFDRVAHGWVSLLTPCFGCINRTNGLPRGLSHFWRPWYTVSLCPQFIVFFLPYSLHIPNSLEMQLDGQAKSSLYHTDFMIVFKVKIWIHQCSEIKRPKLAWKTRCHCQYRCRCVQCINHNRCRCTQFVDTVQKSEISGIWK